MTNQEALATLEEFGTAQNRKVYGRHGVGDDQYGVSYANLKTLKKQVKRDHDLALQLWASGNHDARVFATMIGDPNQAEEALLDSWVQDLDNYVITDAFAGYVSQTPFAQQKMVEWTRSEEEWKGQAGWNLLNHLAMKDTALPDTFFEPFLEIIERDIHTSKNRVRHAMNGALIAIGIRSDALEQRATAAAESIGKVEVDHGQTSCKTPDAIPYIQKTRQRKKR